MEKYHTRYGYDIALWNDVYFNYLSKKESVLFHTSPVSFGAWITPDGFANVWPVLE